MNRIIKWTAMVLAGCILLTALAAVLLPKFIDPNNYRDDISRLIHENTGLTTNINGSISWSVFPWLGLSIDNVSVTGAQDTRLAELGSAEVSVKLLPLLSKKVEVQTAKLIGLNLELVRNKQGQGNWEVDKPSQSKKESPAPTATQQETPKSDSAPLEIDIANVEITELKIRYTDKQTGKTYIVDQASLETGAIKNQQPFDINMQAVVTSKEPAVNLKTSINATITFNLSEGIYDLDNLKISAQPNTANPESLSLTGNVHFQQHPLKAKGQLNVAPFNSRNLLTQLNIPLPPMADKNALNQLAFNTSFQTDGKSFNAETLNLTLDDFNIKGYFRLVDISKQAMTFKFTGNDLNLDRYLPPAAEHQASDKDTEEPNKVVKESSEPVKELPLIPEEMLRGLNLNGTLSLSSLTAAKLEFEKPAIELAAANGRQQIKLESGFYQGSININSKLDVRAKGNPKINTSAVLKSINLHAMAEPVPALKPVEGLVNADMNVHTQGQLQSALTRNLNGTVSFNIDKGAFTEANFDKMVCEGISKIRKTKLEKKEWAESTQFQDLSGTFIIRNGIASNNDLTAALANLNLKGDGKVDLVQQVMDYHVGLNIRGNEAPDSDPACQVNEDYIDVTWPVRCSGKIGEQSCGIDTERLANTVVGLAQKEAQKRIQKEIDKKVEGPLKDVLKGFFK